MREIKFRGKRIDNGEWVYGYFAVDTDTKTNYIIERIYWNCEECSDQTLYCEVDPATVGQYIGLCDNNGKEIYERDFIGFDDCTSTEGGWYEQSCVGKVFWDEESAGFETTGRLSADSEDVLSECVVIGNIHDNPNLLEVTE